VQLGFDRQHFTLPVLACFFELNRGLSTHAKGNDKSGFCGGFLFDRGRQRANLNGQFHLAQTSKMFAEAAAYRAF